MARKSVAKDTKKLKKLTCPPIVTVMGHVDHGKTTLLDYIRKTKVAEKEYGGITQHIGAYQVELSGKKITFIDTPGHAAFTQMRARGANVTDIVVLVVAASEGVKPQTVEAIRLAQDAKVPIIVALNKIDLASADIEKTKKELAENNVFVEGYGGDVVCVPISAKTGDGVDNLLEMILLVSEMQEKSCDPNGPLKMTVIESKMDKTRGPVASVIVLEGTLCVGNEISFGDVKGKVRAMINDKGQKVLEAGPATPVEIVGLQKVPSIGETVDASRSAVQAVTLEDLAVVIAQEEKKKFKIVLKADTLGILEAINYSLAENIELLYKGAGDITDSDVLLAKEGDRLVVGFNVFVPPSVLRLAETEKVKIKIYKIIYELLDELSEFAKKGLTPEASEEIIGKAQIIAEFPFNKVRIAGCKVMEGIISKGQKVRILREENKIGEGKIKSLRHGKDDINKAEVGMECGCLFDSNLDFLVGDAIIAYRSL